MTTYRLPAKSAPVLFALLLSGIMSFMVSGVSTALAVKDPNLIVSLWPSTWLSSWAVAFPTALIVAPFVRKLVVQIVQPASS